MCHHNQNHIWDNEVNWFMLFLFCNLLQLAEILKQWENCVTVSTLPSLPSSESWLSLVSCSICWHQPSMRPVSACSSFKNHWPSLRHSVPPPPLWGTLLLFPLSSQGSGGGREEGSNAGSRLSEKEEELLLVVERLRICLGGGGEEVGSALSKESRPGGELMDWLAQLTMTFFSVGLALIKWEMIEMSCVSESVSCFEAMLLEWLSLKKSIWHCDKFAFFHN